MARTAFVTGGTGFLGRHVVEQLAYQGWRVVALHRRTSDVRGLQTYTGVELALGSITDPASLDRAMPQGCDAVFHVAGNTSLWSGGNAQQTLENVDGTRFVVEACLEKKVGRLVHTSSVASWGEQHVVPFDESAPQHAAGSFVNYERTKYLGELEVLKGVKRGLAACIMNPGHIVGRYDANSWARLHPAGRRPEAPRDPAGRGHLGRRDRGGQGPHHGRREGPRRRALPARRDVRHLRRGNPIIGQLTGRKVPTRAMPGWVIRALGRVSQWGSYVTKRAPQVTPEIAAATSRPPHLFKSDKAIRELGYAAVPLETMLREAYDWLESEGMLRG